MRSITSLFTLFLLSLLTLQQAAAAPLRLGSGTEGGGYYRFAQQLASQLGQEVFEVLPSNGSVDNLEQLAAGTLDIALAQNDIAHYSYYGKNGYHVNDGFMGLLPLFPEYVQILVRADGPIRILRDLQNRTIAIGLSNSGSHKNAIDVLSEIGLRKNIDYLAVESGVTDSLAMLKQGKVDALFITGQPFGGDNSRDITTLPIPAAVIRSLSARMPYYSSARLNGDSNSETLTVTAYLLVASHLADEQVATLARALYQNWGPLQASTPNLLPLEQALNREPFPIHPEMLAIFEELGVVDGTGKHISIVIVSLLLILAVAWAQRRAHAYDRMGNAVVTGGRVMQLLIRATSKSGIFLYVVFVFTLLLSSVVILLQFFEASYTREMNIDNPFAFIDFNEALLWMFTFMGSGFTGDYYPSSPPGKILVAIIPFIGVTSLLGILFVTTNRLRESAMSKMRGMAQLNLKNHVLICGWNEAVPGLVYTLTGDDAPEKKHVAIVAEMDGDTPLESYHFDQRYVSYCRGDSADFDVLNRACAAQADAAVVVAGVKKRAGKNIRSVLTVLALKNFASQNARQLYVAAELVHRENRGYFDACDTDALVMSELLVSRLAAFSCLYDGVIDFVLDALTYGTFSNLYAIPVERLGNHEMSAPQLSHRFAAHGVNLLGYMSQGAITRGLIGASNGSRDGSGIFAADTLHYQPQPGDRLIVFANKGNELLKGDATLLLGAETAPPAIAQAPSISTRAIESVLLVGPLARCLEVREQLNYCQDAVEQVIILTPDSVEQAGENIFCGDLTEATLWQTAIAGRSVDRVVVLSLQMDWMQQGVDFQQDRGDMDARTILLAKTAGEMLAMQPSAPRIIAEMINPRCRSLFRSAGVDTVIPATVLIERIMAKLIYNRGVVSQWLSELLSFRAARHIVTQRVVEGDGFHGLSFRQLAASYWPGFKVMGWIPADSAAYLGNRRDDYATHVVTHPSGEFAEREVQPGDLMILARQRPV